MTFRCLAAWQGADSLLPPPCPRTRRQILLLPGHGVPPRGPAHPAPGRNLLHPRPGGGQRLRPAGHERLRAGRALRPVLHDDPRAARQLGAVRRGVRGQGARGHGVALPVHERVQGRLRLAQEQARGAFLRRRLPRPARAAARPGGEYSRQALLRRPGLRNAHPPAGPPTHRDHPVPEERDGIMSCDSSRTQGGAEITTYDSLDKSLGQARDSLYLGGKAWAAYVLLNKIFAENDLPARFPIFRSSFVRVAYCVRFAVAKRGRGAEGISPASPSPQSPGAAADARCPPRRHPGRSPGHFPPLRTWRRRR